MNATVRVRIKNETNSGNRKGWSKLVTSVDASKTNGYAFEGRFLNDDQEYDVEVGSVIVQQHPEGSVKRGWNSGHCYTIGEDGSLYETDGKSYKWYEEFLSFRDHAKVLTDSRSQPAPAVAEPAEQPPTAAELLAALENILASYDANDSRGIGEEIERSRNLVARAKGVAPCPASP